MQLIPRTRKKHIAALRRELATCTIRRGEESFQTTTRRAWEAYDEEPGSELYAVDIVTYRIVMPDKTRYELKASNSKFIIPPTYTSLNMPCVHGSQQVVGYIVTFGKTSRCAVGNILYEDIKYIEDRMKHAEAEAVKAEALEQIQRGESGFGWVVIHNVYACGHRLA